MTYWAKHLSEIRQDISVDVIAAELPKRVESTSIVHVPDRGRSWARALLQDAGISWRLDLKDHFLGEGRGKRYDYVILSGGPFMHFGIASHIKEAWHAKVIIDFRDPFARNARFGSQPVKRIVKRCFENRFVALADRIITVNTYCADLLPPSARGKLSIIDNGYDEVVLSRRRTLDMAPGYLHLVYAGSFMEDKDPTVLLATIRSTGLRNTIKLHHVGKPSSYVKPFLEEPFLVQHGVKSYEDTIDIINSCDAGLLLTGGEPFESLTKTFDYIGCRKPIVIITRGRERTGNLHELTRTLPSVHWVNHTPENIREFFRTYERPVFPQDYDTYRYSRKYGLEQLSDLLK